MSEAEPLWTKYDVAAFAGVEVATVPNWIKRRGVPVAGHTEPVQGRVLNLYRPAAIRAARDGAPGKGNRTPRKPAETAAEAPEPVDGPPVPNLTKNQVSVLQVLLQFEEIKAITRHTGWVDATTRRGDIENPAVDAVHVNVARSLEAKGLVTLTRIPPVRGLYAEDGYTRVELTEAGRAAAHPYRVPPPVNMRYVRVVPSVELRLAALKLRQLSDQLHASTIRSAMPVIELARKINGALAVHEVPRRHDPTNRKANS